jgi:hypothetical protein
MAVWGAVASIGGKEGSKYINLYATVRANKSNYRAMLNDVTEIRRATEVEIKNLRDTVDSFANEQAIQYLSSGVKLEGTAMRVISDTYKKGEEEALELRRASNKRIDELNRQMKLNKKATKSAIAAAIFGSGSSVINSYSSIQANKQ